MQYLMEGMSALRRTRRYCRFNNSTRIPRWLSENCSTTWWKEIGGRNGGNSVNKFLITAPISTRILEETDVNAQSKLFGESLYIEPNSADPRLLIVQSQSSPFHIMQAAGKHALATSAEPRLFYVLLLRISRAVQTAGNLSHLSGNDIGNIQKNRHQRRNRMRKPTPANGPYWLSSNSQLMRTAALRYLALSSLNLLLTCPMRSRLSPRYNKSSIFLVMTFVTSRSSSFSLSRFWVARVSE
jgi:hypothetical protein